MRNQSAKKPPLRLLYGHLNKMRGGGCDDWGFDKVIVKNKKGKE